MYKLLLVTNAQKVRDAFAAVSWENLGFKEPRMAATTEEAISSLKAYHADAIAIALPQSEDDALIRQLMSLYPELVDLSRCEQNTEWFTDNAGESTKEYGDFIVECAMEWLREKIV